MKLKNPLLVVADLEQTKAFYQSVLGLHVISDFGANLTFTGGLSVQTKASWQAFINKTADEIKFQGNDAEIYFEEDDFDGFIAKLVAMPGIDYVHPAQEHPWGQRAVRIYDPDKHIIEVGENLKAVCKRFLDQGMTLEEAAKRMDVSLTFAQALTK